MEDVYLTTSYNFQVSNGLVMLVVVEIILTVIIILLLL